MKRYLKYIFLLVLFCFPLFPKALTRSARLYWFDSNNQPQLYLSLTQQQITQGVSVSHTSGSFPSGLSLRYDDYTYLANTDYIITTSFTIRSQTSIVTFTDATLSISYWYNDDGYDTQYTLLSSSSCGSNCYEANYTITSKFKPTTQVSNAIQWLFFTYSRYVTYFKVNSYSVDQTSSLDSSAIISNNNQNTSNIINNQNQNTQDIIDTISDLSEGLLNDSLDSFPSGGGGGSYFDSIAQTSGTPISDLILLPYNFLNAIYNQLANGRCLPFSLGLLYSSLIEMPCLNLETLFGSTVWGIIDSLFCIFMYYNIFCLGVRTYDKWTSLVDTFQDIFKGGM